MCQGGMTWCRPGRWSRSSRWWPPGPAPAARPCPSPGCPWTRHSRTQTRPSPRPGTLSPLQWRDQSWQTGRHVPEMVKISNASNKVSIYKYQINDKHAKCTSLIKELCLFSCPSAAGAKAMWWIFLDPPCLGRILGDRSKLCRKDQILYKVTQQVQPSLFISSTYWCKSNPQSQWLMLLY